MKNVILKIEWDNEKLTDKKNIAGIKWYLKDLKCQHSVTKILNVDTEKRTNKSVCPKCGGSPIEQHGADKYCPYCEYWW